MNYRGISLLSCISKLYSAFINRRLTKFLGDHDILADEQNGFRANRSCEDHVFTLDSITRNHNNVFTAFIDLRKCFDFIDRDMMLYKLLRNNIDGKLYGSVKSIYQHSVSCVRINNKCTEWFDCKTGVKQGDNLSPTFFSIFVNDLVSEINDLDLGVTIGDSKLSMLLYADDIVFISLCEANLQRMLDCLNEWCKRWRVLINTSKSKCMHFRKGRTQRTDFRFTVGNDILETVENYKYLGVIMNDKLNYTQHCESIAKGAGRALGGVISKIHNIKEFGFNTYEKLYSSCVIPILDYNSSVWGFKQYQHIDNVQNRAMRYYLGVHRFAPTLAITGDTGWLPSIYRHWINIIRFWNRLTLLADNRLTKRIFNADYTICHNNWSEHVKQIFDKLDLINHFTNKTIVNLDTARQKMSAYHSGLWSRDVQKVSKLRTYITIKSEPLCEEYVKTNLSRQERALLSQFRCGILPLRVETGRYVGETPEQRISKLCTGNHIEDEQHFLISCPLYNDIRNDTIYRGNPNIIDMGDTEKFKHIMRNYPRKAAKFIVAAFMRRRRTIYRI